MVAASSLPAAPVFAAMGLGVLVAMTGHLTRLRWLIACGLTLLFVATAGMLVGGYVAYHRGDPDPRDQRDVREPGF